MPSLNLLTYRDAVMHLVDYLGANPRPEAIRNSKTAVLNAHREMATAARWVFYYTHGRVNTVASYSTGTIAYDSATRHLTLTSGTWPSWSAYGTVVILNVSYEVASRVSDSIITLSTNSNPGADIAAGTSYVIFRDTYPMPLDFVAADGFMNQGNFTLPVYVHVGAWLDHQRLSKQPAIPRIYTFRGDPHYQGALGVSFYPPPDTIYQYDFIYQRRPRQLKVYEENTGTVTVSSGSATVAGSDTAFDATHVGAVIRFSANATDAPEGLAWSTPYYRERVITAVTDASTLTLDTVMDVTVSGVKYVISDPVDIEPGAMQTAFLRCCEKQEAIVRIMKNRADADAAWKQALIEARESDNRSFGDRVAGQRGVLRQRLAYMPRGSDVS